MNLDYRTIYKVRTNPAPSERVARIPDKYNALAQAEFRRRFPRRKNIDLNALPAEYIEQLKAEFDAEYQAARLRLERRKKLLDDLLYRLAPSVPLIPQAEHFNLEQCDGGEYHTQGYGANKYARGKLVYPAELLADAGFDVRIDEQSLGSNQHMTFWRYTLIANCELWRFDALMHCKPSVEGWLRCCGKHHINPWVYAPLLPHKPEYEALAYGK